MAVYTSDLAPHYLRRRGNIIMTIMIVIIIVIIIIDVDESVKSFFLFLFSCEMLRPTNAESTTAVYTVIIVHIDHSYVNVYTCVRVISIYVCVCVCVGYSGLRVILCSSARGRRKTSDGPKKRALLDVKGNWSRAYIIQCIWQHRIT